MSLPGSPPLQFLWIVEHCLLWPVVVEGVVLQLFLASGDFGLNFVATILYLRQLFLEEDERCFFLEERLFCLDEPVVPLLVVE